ncbi:MAG: vWA domain-containing protein [Candidatus Bathyarchaeia archaeon]
MEVKTVQIDPSTMKEVFAKVKSELFFPPLQFKLNDKLNIPVKVLNGELNVNPVLLSKSKDPYRLLLWLLRHTLAHMHYCPYDAKTAYYLQKIAYSILRDSRLAYTAVAMFSDFQVDCIYLKNRYDETPYHLRDNLSRCKLVGLEQLIFAVYREFYPDLIYKPVDDEVEILGRLLADSIKPPKSWVSKIKAISAVLLRAEMQENKRTLKKPSNDRLGLRYIPLIEDAYPDSVKRISQVLSNIENERDAKTFYEVWIKPRMGEEDVKKISDKIRDALRKSEEAEHIYTSKEPGKAYKAAAGRGHGKFTLPTSIGKLLEKIPLDIKDLLWRRLWYRARAENILITYLASRGEVKPTWTIQSYPEEWYVEDDIESLDIEASLDEGPMIPEVTTVKWHMRAAGRGGELHTNIIPSVLVVLDTSYSMSNILDKVSIAGFIAYLSAKWAGGNTAVVNFSTNHVVADWSVDDDFKELVLSSKFRELTIMPTKTIGKLLNMAREQCFVVVITDGGWQNFKEALEDLKAFGNRGHRISVFYIKDWDYPEEVKALVKAPYINVYPVNDPVRDLEGLILSEVTSIYAENIRPLIQSSY